MIKVGVVTLNDNNNYGNRLQAYAVQEFFRKNSLISENIYTGPNICFNMIKSKIKFLINHKNQRSLSRRYKYFKQFNRNISFSKFKIIKGNVSKKIDKEYDCFFVGSDQVWRTKFNPVVEDMFLSFADDFSGKRIAYAASFGTDEWEFTDEQTERCKELVKRFDAVSVRERSGIRLVKWLGQNADYVLDPTMLMDKDFYSSIIDGSPYKGATTSKLFCYILCYVSLVTSKHCH